MLRLATLLRIVTLIGAEGAVDHLTCDHCGEGLLHDGEVRYRVRIEVKSAYDVMELTEDDLNADHGEEMRRILARLSGRDPESLEDQVYKLIELDLCATCQKGYIRDPHFLEIRGRPRWDRRMET